MENSWFIVYGLVIGLCIGSFLNVVIYRLPMGRSIADPPRSVCPHCGQQLTILENIPVLSYLWLRGHCRHCHAPIAFRYPLVELLGGAMGVACAMRFGPGGQALVAFGLMAVLLSVSFIDLDYRIIPDRITLPGVALFYLATVAATPLTWRQAAAGAMVGAGILYLVAVGYRILTHREGMGFGDVKLMALIGVVVGWQGAVFAIFSGAVYGTLAGTLAMVGSGRGLKTAVPFGPFLSAGATTYLLTGPELILLYRKSLGPFIGP